MRSTCAEFHKMILTLSLLSNLNVAGIPVQSSVIAPHSIKTLGMNDETNIDLNIVHHKRLWDPSSTSASSEGPQENSDAVDAYYQAETKKPIVVVGQKFYFNPDASYKFDTDVDCDGHILHAADLQKGVEKYKNTAGSPLDVAVEDPPSNLHLGQNIVEFAYQVPAQYGHARVSVAFWESRKPSFRGTEATPPKYTLANVYYFDNQDQPVMCNLFYALE